MGRSPAVADEPHLVRIARARVRPGCEAEFESTFESVTVPERRGIPGMLRLYRMRRTGTDGVLEYVIVSVWRSRADLERYKSSTGGPPIPPELAHTLEGGSLEEYELVAVDDYDVF